MKYTSILIFSIILFSCSLPSRNSNLNEYEHMFKVEFISIAYKRFLDDEKWKDRVSCYGGHSDFSKSEIEYIHHVVDSLEKVFTTDIQEATNGTGSSLTHEFDGYCVIKSIMETANSKSFKKISNEYASRKFILKTKKK